MNTLRNDKNAVSQVFAILLMLATTVLLVAAVSPFVLDFGPIQPKSSFVYIKTDTNSSAIFIKHSSGDTLKSNYWKISITKDNNPKYAISNIDFKVGDFITFRNQTTTSDTINNTNPSTSGAVIEQGEYYIKIVDTKTNTVIFDSKITVQR